MGHCHHYLHHCPLTVTRLLCVNTRHQLMARDVWWHWEGQLGPGCSDQGPVTGPVHSCLVRARVTRWATASLSHLWPLILALRRSQIVPGLNSEYLK